MVVRTPFAPTHVESVAARAAELERTAEESRDPHAYVRAAYLYAIAARIADDIAGRGSDLFGRTDLARVRHELRLLARDAAAASTPDDRRDPADPAIPPDGQRGRITGAFREIVVRIEQRLLDEEARSAQGPRPEPDTDRRS